jgi:hypothetical protein
VLLTFISLRNNVNRIQLLQLIQLFFTTHPPLRSILQQFACIFAKLYSKLVDCVKV